MTGSAQSGQPCVTLSFDFEIGWGDITNSMWKRREQAGVYRRLRAVLPEMLDAMADRGISATWATVGAMIDDPAARKLDHLPTSARDVVDESLKSGETTSFDGRDLFDMVLNCRAEQEIASHSYAHVPLNWPDTDASFFAADLTAFCEALATFGIETDRYVYPEHREGHLDVLAASPFTLLRSGAETAFSNRWLYLATTPFIAPPLSRETRVGMTDDARLVRRTGSMLFNDAGSSWKVPLLLRRMRLGLKRAIAQGGTLHIWAHPFNFAESAALLSGFLKMLDELASARDAGQIVIEPL